MISKDYSHRLFETHARTLPASAIGTHKSGWTISGEIYEDWFEWVNDFVATHEVYGIVEGDFEKTVYATSPKALKHFLKHHPFEEWDYWDI